MLTGWEVAYDKYRERKQGKGAPAPLSILVIDPAGSFLHDWDKKFSNLEIQWLRSPVLAHPDSTEEASLFEFALSQGMESDIMPADDLWKTELKGQAVLSSGLFGLPSTKLFRKFCSTLSEKYSYDFRKEKVVAINWLKKAKEVQSSTPVFKVECENGSLLFAKRVVLAIGTTGQPNIPDPYKAARMLTLSNQNPRLPVFHSNDPNAFQQLTKGQHVLVIGGGLSAIQAALKFEREGARVTLCSRSPLRTRLFDIPLYWFNPKEHRRHRFEFYSLEMEKRLAWIVKERSGGTVPPIYIQQLEEKKDSIHHIVDPDLMICNESCCVIRGDGSAIGPLQRVVLCTGRTVDCASIPLIANILSNCQQELGLECVSGLPRVNDHMRWGNEKSSLYIVGALAMLQAGPDAANLMGIKQAAVAVADDLGIYKHHYEEEGARNNRFSFLLEE